MLSKDNSSQLTLWGKGNTGQNYTHEYSLHPYQQFPDSENLQTTSLSHQGTSSNQPELLENHSGHKPYSYCHTTTYSGQNEKTSVEPQPPSTCDDTACSCYTNPSQTPAYSQEAECSFNIIVVTPQKQGKSPLCCKECGQHFTKESNLKKHIERLSQQLEEPYYKCKYCSHVFKSKEARKRHQPVHKMCMTNSFIRIRCSVCGFSFSSKEKLQHHLHRFTENSDERIFKCFFCSHAFTTDFSRNRHEGQMHTGSHKLPCCCCGKLFGNRYKLKLHRLKQQIQPPPRCQDCGWVFAAQEYLDDHIRQVSRNLPLECLVCNHRYHSQLALMRHLKYHTRKMEHECPSCLGRFPSENLLTKHLRTAPQRASVELHLSGSSLSSVP